MHTSGVFKPALPLLFSCQTPTPKNLSFSFPLFVYTFTYSFFSLLPISYLSLVLSSTMVEALYLSTSMLALPILLLLLVLGVRNGVHCFEEQHVLNLQKFQLNHKTGISSCISRKSRQEKGATILEMKHRDRCSGKIIDWNENLQKRIILDDVRVQSLQSHIKNMIAGNVEDVSKTEIPLISGIKLETLNYIVTMELGGRKMTVIVDTGSDLTWVQCMPCKQCYNQKDPLFNPSISHSYQKILCNSSTCQSLQLATGNAGVCGGNPPICEYTVRYGDGSYTRGDLGREHLYLGNTSMDNFVFGCGRNNKGLFGGVSGLMGLGRSDISLVSQSSAIFGGVFSYCLPTTEAEASGSLILGGNSLVFKNSTPISYTRMISNPQSSTFYFLNLTGISVGGVALQATRFGKGGMLIDSGTIITRLPPSIYGALKTQFLKQFSGYPLASGFSILDTCFDLSGYQEVSLPPIQMQFEGDSVMNVDVHGIFYIVKADASQVCLAFASLAYENEIGIIGNYQQTNQRVIYNNKESKLGFAGEACSFI